MRFTIQILGFTLVEVTATRDSSSSSPVDSSPGDCTTYPIGFAPPDPAPSLYDVPPHVGF